MLCSTCESLELSIDHFIIRTVDEYESWLGRGKYLGSLQSIRDKSDSCTLCNLIVEAIGGSSTLLGPQDEEVKCQLTWFDPNLEDGNDVSRPRILGVEFDPELPLSNFLNRLIPLADHLPGREGLFLGRRIKQHSINIKRIKKWMKLCQKRHGQVCEDILTSIDRDFPSNLRMVDTWDRCIVEAPLDCKFLALSYVWGNAKVFKLSTDNFLELQVKGAMNSVWQSLPRTVRDAISLTSLLSIRYLWIDSLGILQDDSSDKHSLIPCMHMIYDRAFMTIVAASGDSAEAGLPGVDFTPRGQQQTAKMSSGCELISPVHLSEALDQAIYGSRAWTYQERILSRRCLIFVKGIVIFQCRSGLWREDVFLEDNSVGDNEDMKCTVAISGTRARINSHDIYASSLLEYSSRFLTYDSDVVDAFAGVLDVLCEQMSDGRNPELKHAYGLPTYIFEWALLWKCRCSNYRRSNEWPSWSWCGWVGVTEMFLASISAAGLRDWLSNHTWIDWIIYDLHGQPIMQIPSKSTYQRVKPANVQLQQFQNQAKLSPAPLSNAQALIRSCSSYFSQKTMNTCFPFLHFKTVSLSLHLTWAGLVRPQLRRITHDSQSSIYKIHRNSTSHTPVFYGYVTVDDTWQYDADPERTYEFLLLSEAAGRTDAEMTYIEAFILASGVKGPGYFAMLIQRDAQNEQVAQRVGLTAFGREAVDMALKDESGPYRATWKELWLR